MAYSEKSAARLAALHGEIEARKEHEFAAPTYRDTAALAEIRQTVFNQLESEHEHDRDTVEDSIAVLRYLAENYENMGRTAPTCGNLRRGFCLWINKFKSKKTFLKTIRCLCATVLNYRKSILRLSMRLSGCSKKNAEKMRIRLKRRR